ncbi:unnamed protein product [Lampetra planeri]
MLCGGTQKVQTATADIQKIADEMKSHAEEKTGKKFSTFEAKTFTTQVVAGTNYFIKVRWGMQPPPAHSVARNDIAIGTNHRSLCLVHLGRVVPVLAGAVA